MKKSTSKFNETFIKNYNENSGKGYIYPKNLHDLHNDLLFLPEKLKTKKCCKLVHNLHHKKCVAHIRTLRQALNHGYKKKGH